MLEIYKKGQGTRARWVAAIGLLGFSVFGCYSLDRLLRIYVETQFKLGIFTVYLSTLISGVAFLGAVLLVALLVNSKRFVDYLINSEAELRKVAWPTREELKRQTTIVIVTIVFFSLVLLVADSFFAFASSKLFGIR